MLTPNVIQKTSMQSERLCSNLLDRIQAYIFMPPPVVKGVVSFAFVRPSHTQRITPEPEGLECRNSESLPPLMRLAYHFQSQKVKITRPINADIHPVAYLPMRTYRVPLVVVVWPISWPFPYQFALKLTCSILTRDHNIATQPIFSKIVFYNLEFCRQKQLFANFYHISSSSLQLYAIDRQRQAVNARNAQQPINWKQTVVVSPKLAGLVLRTAGWHISWTFSYHFAPNSPQYSNEGLQHCN